MDDIAVVGMPDTIDTAAMLRYERETGGSDGVYPIYMTDTNGDVTLNPMEVNEEKYGLTCSYLDMLAKKSSYSAACVVTECVAATTYRAAIWVYPGIAKAPSLDCKRKCLASKHEGCVICSLCSNRLMCTAGISENRS